MNAPPAHLLAAVDQGRAAAEHVLAQLADADRAGAELLTAEERWLGLFCGAVDSGATRETLAAAVAAAVIRLTDVIGSRP